MKTTANEDVEFLGIEIIGVNNDKLLIICVYNPHKTNGLNPFFEQLRMKVLKYENINVCGMSAE